MNYIRRESHTPALGAALDPFGLMHSLMRWSPVGIDPQRVFEPRNDLGAFMPAFDIRETSDGYIFTGDMPGIRQEDLEIHITGNILGISGKRDAESRKEGENYFAMERSFGAFNRTFNLPEGVDANAVGAELKDGVLTLTVPKIPEVQPRRIAISTKN